ncbi:MAG: hypothetical protein HY290_24520 [Planctomycetia bacterium]|nr:hypothetical protein [Planctomycetia bacterium]
MAFDVYAGTFTRYYTRTWENVVQRRARIDGIQYKIICAGGDPEPPPPAHEVRSLVDSWREGINQGLAPHGLGPIEWSEDDCVPYFTDRPGWQGYSGLLLWAVYAQLSRSKPPYALPETWVNDPVYQDVLRDEKSIRYQSILQANLWLPGDFQYCFKFPGLAGDEESTIASTGWLLAQLTQLRAEEPKWTTQSLLQRVRGTKDDEYALESAAKDGLAIFSDLAQQAVTHRVPIVLSF